MRRERLWLEGHNTIDGRCIQIRSAQFEQYERYPLTSHNNDVIGFLTDIRREADGWVTGEPVLIPNYHWVEGVVVSAAFDMFEGRLRFRAGHLITTAEAVWKEDAR